jgi:hypothetical protein
MKKPKNLTTPIRIGAIEYDVKHTEDLKTEEGDADLMGCIRHLECEIHLRTGMKTQISRAVLLHEIVHGMLSQAGVQDHSEHAIDAIAFGLLELERNNPNLVKFNLDGFLE